MSNLQNKKKNIIVDPTRFEILCLLLEVEFADFIYLKTQLGLTQGNLSFHLTKLEKFELINSFKEFKDKLPISRYSISKEGRELLHDYLKMVSKIAEKHVKK